MNQYPENKLKQPGVDPIGLEHVIDFHESTKGKVETDYFFSENVYEYLFEYRGKMETATNLKNYFAFSKIELPSVRLPSMSYADILTKRVSVREYSDSPLSLETLSLLLTPFRCTREAVIDDDFDIRLQLRPYASPGGLYPCELYVAILNVENQLPCICHYNPRDHTLTPIKNLVLESFWAAVGERGNAGLTKSGACIFVTSLFERTVAKYGPLGYRFALIESGVIAHHFTLSAVNCNLSALVWGGYFDEETNSLLDVDGYSETVVNCVFIGHPVASAG